MGTIALRVIKGAFARPAVKLNVREIQFDPDAFYRINETSGGAFPYVIVR